MAVTYKELSLVAELHYARLPDAFKVKAAEFFDTLDLDGDGIVTLPELLNSNLERKFGEEFIKDVFYSIDVEGKDHLNFQESLALYYLCMYSARLCEGCGRNIPQGLGYTCFKCWKEGFSSMDGQPFSWCLECYSSANYQHAHEPLHLMHDFVLFDNLFHDNKPSSPTSPMGAPVRAVEQTLKQCIVCGDHHESKVHGFTCDLHMAKMRDSTEFVCEWCFSYLCSKCGNLFRDSSTRAEPGKWLQRFVCPSCHSKNITTDCYDTSLKKLQRMLGGVDLLKHCRTCDIKYKNGTLFWIVNGTNMVSSSSSGIAGLNSHQQRQSRSPAAAYAKGRSNFGDQQPQSSNFGGRVPGNLSSPRSSSGGISSHGSGSSNRRGFQEGKSCNGVSRGGAYESSAGDMSQAYVRDEGGNMGPRHGRGVYINRSAAQGSDGSNLLSRGGAGTRVGTGPSGRQTTLQDKAASAMQTANRMIDAANMAANLFNASSGGEDGENEGVDVANLAANMFNGFMGGNGGSGEGEEADWNAGAENEAGNIYCK